MFRNTAVVLSLFVLILGSATARTRIDGAWTLTRIDITGESGNLVVENPPSGLYLFTRGHYSMVWSLRRTPRPASAQHWHATDEERQSHVAGFIVNSGTFELTDTLLTVHPIVARTPEYMGGQGLLRYELSGDTLRLTALEFRSSAGLIDSSAISNSITRTLVRAQDPAVAAVPDSARPTPIVWWELASPDEAASVEFFKNVFNWPLAHNERLGFNVGEVPTPGGSSMWGGIYDINTPQLPFVSLYLQVDDVDAKAAEITAAGGAIRLAPFNISEHARICLFNDPSGVTWALIGPPVEEESEE